MRHAICIGAGVNSLVAALHLQKAGFRVQIIESHGHIGGLAASEEFHPGYHSLGTLMTPSFVLGQPAPGLDAHGLRFDAPAPLVC